EYPGWADYAEKHAAFKAAQDEAAAPKAEVRPAPAPATKGKGLWHLKREVAGQPRPRVHRGPRRPHLADRGRPVP
ncbi:hypothetical protein CTI14_57380, partial [Methylobacterium radiotolerans]